MELQILASTPSYQEEVHKLFQLIGQLKDDSRDKPI